MFQLKREGKGKSFDITILHSKSCTENHVQKMKRRAADSNQTDLNICISCSKGF